MNYSIILGILLFVCFQESIAQSPESRWQQRAEYVMDIDFDTKNHQFKGKQKLTYFNNSPDTLTKVFYHLYFNAFQPGSAMDVRSRTIADPDPRVRDRIFKLKPNEIGYQKINSLKQDGQALQYEMNETILEVTLAKPILPNKKVVFEMDFEAQVPMQIRRSGRNNKEGIDYSMTQWYPKLCEYDYQGWHANPYIGREFYGVWGDFEVKISLDSAYVIGGTGYLQNPLEIGHGYEPKGAKVKRPNSPKLTWHFKAPNVHDFAWAADPDFIHEIIKASPETDFHFFYQTSRPETVKNWKEFPKYALKAFEGLNKHFGKYPYKQYSFIQGGDGGMEYPMATLMLGDGSLGAVVGTGVHELAHSWFQGVLATNESLYAWMDEGFDTYATDAIQEGAFPHEGSYESYFNLVESKTEEPLSTHADHFHTNRAYSTAAYSKGAVFLAQLGYVIGEDALARTMLNYYNTWKFKHPNVNDFIRIAEKASGLELDWYKEYMVNSIHTVDYAIQSIESNNGNTYLNLERTGRFPMPLDILVTYKDGSKELYYIPLELMRGEKPHEMKDANRIIKQDWYWTYPTYKMNIARPAADIQSIEIDPSQRLADIKRENNSYPKNQDKTLIDKKK
jgi:hypothetical protein